jgi:hypothetical protein
MFWYSILQTVCCVQVTCSLVKLLDHPDGAAAFQQFLSLEFSVENLLFYREVQTFKAMGAVWLNTQTGAAHACVVCVVVVT